MEQGCLQKMPFYQHFEHFNCRWPRHTFTGGHSVQHGMVNQLLATWLKSNRSIGARIHRTESSVKKAGSNAGRLPKSQRQHHWRQLVLASANQSRVFSVSVKDRGAIIPGGPPRQGLYSRTNGQFVSSSFTTMLTRAGLKNGIRQRKQINIKIQPGIFCTHRSYIAAQQDDRSYEQSYKQLTHFRTPLW